MRGKNYRIYMNLYVQFCKNEMDDWSMFENNFLFIFEQLLPENIASSPKYNSRKGKKSKKKYKFDFEQAILHCFKARQLQTLTFLMENQLVVNVESALLKFCIDDVIKRIRHTK